MIALDTNVLIYAHRSEFPEHDAARHALTELSEGPLPFGLPVTVVGEFLRVATHPRVLAPPTPRAVALGVVDALVASPRARLLGASGVYWPLLRGFVDDLRLSGNAVFDAQIAAACLANGFTKILTNDRDFRRFDGLEVRRLDP